MDENQESQYYADAVRPGQQIAEEVSRTLDERMSEWESDVEKKVARKVLRRIKREPFQQTARNFQKFQENLQSYHKVFYSFLVILGVVFFWYGAWSIIRIVPLLNNGLISLGVGLTLLFVTGAIYKKLAG